MTQSYQPGIHTDRFRNLPATQRDAINQQANAVFARRTGVRRKLDPKTDRHLCRQWLQIRDEVMAGSGRDVSLRSLANHIEQFSPISTLQQFGSDVADHYMAPWMTIARAEEKRNVVEIPGKKHHPRIMDYIRTCDTLYATANKAKYTEREGEEGVKWCSAFVNWCMSEVGLKGTRDARALSWLTWGKPLPGPQFGAVVVMKTASWRHVAFVDRVDGRFTMLGGNQKRASGGGISDRVSYRPLNSSIILGYRWPV